MAVEYTETATIKALIELLKDFRNANKGGRGMKAREKAEWLVEHGGDCARYACDCSQENECPILRLLIDCTPEDALAAARSWLAANPKEAGE